MNIETIPSNPVRTDPAAEQQRLRKACADFESILINTMLQSMRKTLGGDDIFGKSLGRDIYQSMYDTQLSKELAQNNNGLGVGEMLFRQLSAQTLRPEKTGSFSGSSPVDPLQKYRQQTDTNIDVK